MAYSARVICDSVSPFGDRLTTIEVTFPRIVLAEFNTHRVFSRNSASSRAIPVEKRIAMVEADPFIPEAFGKNKKGMQAGEDLDEEASRIANNHWIAAMHYAVEEARSLAGIGVHKQLANRLIEPYTWQTVLVTATEWDNFYALRCNPAAQPEIRKAAELMKAAHDASTPLQLEDGRWHLPLTPELDHVRDSGVIDWDFWKRVSVGRCARVSYLTHDGKRDTQADIDLCNRLLVEGHMSPFEHVARPSVSNPEFIGNFKGWVQYRKELPDEDNFKKVLEKRA